MSLRNIPPALAPKSQDLTISLEVSIVELVGEPLAALWDASCFTDEHDESGLDTVGQVPVISYELLELGVDRKMSLAFGGMAWSTIGI